MAQSIGEYLIELQNTPYEVQLGRKEACAARVTRVQSQAHTWQPTSSSYGKRFSSVYDVALTPKGSDCRGLELSEYD